MREGSAQDWDEAGVAHFNLVVVAGQSGKVFWKSWNVRHFLSNRRMRSWPYCRGEAAEHMGCFEKASRGGGA